MNWTEVTMETKPEAVDYLCAAIMGAGITGFQIENDEEDLRFLEENASSWDYLDESLQKTPRENAFIRLYLDPGDTGKSQLADVEQAAEQLRAIFPQVNFGSLSVTLKLVDDADWLENWKKYYKPFKIGKNIVIRPFWEDYTSEGELILTIDPGHLFGTGLHQTTRMCMEALERLVKKGGKMADIGCGSGILSVLALLLGASYAYACDIEAAASVAYTNAALNGIGKDRYLVETANILTDEGARSRLTDKSFDIITANIVADVIIPLCPHVKKMLKPGGSFAASGIIRARLDEVKSALEANGFQIREVMESDEWFCIISENGL